MPLLAAVLAVLLLAPPASAQWTPEPLPVRERVHLPALVFAGDGTAIATWQLFEPPVTRYRLSRRAPAGGWSAPCSAPGGQVAAYGRTRVVALQAETERLGVAFGRSTGCPGRVRSLRRARQIRAATLAANPRGDLAVAWFEDRGTANDRVYVALRRPGRGFAFPELLAEGRLRDVTVAVGARGDVLVAWEARGRVRARFRRAGARRFGPTETIASDPTYFAQVRAAVAPNGRAYLGWTAQLLTEGGDFGPAYVQTATRPAGARRFRAAQRLERIDGRPIVDAGPLQLAIDAAGAATAAWTGLDGETLKVRAAATDGRAAFGAPVTLGDGAVRSVAPGVVLFANERDELFASVGFGAPEPLGTGHEGAVALDRGTPWALWASGEQLLAARRQTS